MTQTIQAVYVDGVFRPVEAVDLPDRCEVEVEVRRVNRDTRIDRTPVSSGLARVYEILSERYDSGHTDLAERHNEHQP